MKSSFFVAAAIASLVLVTAAPVQAEAGDAIVATWLTSNGEAKIHFAKEGSDYVGRVVWLKTPNNKDGQPVTDEKNPDAKLRTRQMMGAAIVWGMHFDGKEYVDGRLYDPESGSTYKGKATVESADKLTLRGYVGIPIFGRSDSWSRVN